MDKIKILILCYGDYMKKFKNFKRKFVKERNYIFLFVMILISTAIFFSLITSGQLMRDTAESYLNKFKIEDMKLVSSHGIGKEELDLIEENINASSINVGYQMDVGVEGTSSLMNIESMPESWVKFDLKEGRLPEKSGEIAVDEDLTDFPYKIGDTIKLNRKGDNPVMRLKRKDFVIVGRISSPEYILQSEKGQSNFTGSTLDGYGLIMEEDFDLNKVNFARISLEETKNLSLFSDEYKAIVDNEAYKLTQAFASMPEKKIDIVKVEAEDRIARSENEIKALETERKKQSKDIKDEDKEVKSLRSSYEKNQADFDQKLKASLDMEKTGPEKKTKLDEEVKNLKANKDKLQGQYDVQASEVNTINEEYEPIRSEYESLSASINEMQATIDSDYAYVNSRLDEVSGEIASIRSGLVGESIRGLIEATQRLQNLQDERDQLEARQNELVNMQASVDQDLARLGEIEGSYTSLKTKYDSAASILNDYEESLESVKAQLEEKASAKEELDKNLKEAQDFLSKEKEPKEKSLAKEKSDLEAREKSHEDNNRAYKAFMEESEKEIKNLKAIIKRSKEERDGKVMPTYDIDLSSNNNGIGLYSSITGRVDMMTRLYPMGLLALALIISLVLYYRIFDEAGMDLKRDRSTALLENKDTILKSLGLTGLALLIGLVLSYGLSFAIFMLYGDSFIFSRPLIRPYALFGLILILGFALSLGLALLINFASPGQINFEGAKSRSINNLMSHPVRAISSVASLALAIGLIFLGLALSRSIRNISSIQFNDIVRYQVEIELPEKIDAKDMGDLEFFISDIKGARDVRDMAIYQSESLIDGYPSVDFELRVPKTLDNFDRQIRLLNKDKHKIDIPEEGIIISKKMAEVNGLIPGDSLAFTVGDSKKYEAIVVDIFENYISDFAYMSPAYFKSIVGSDPSYRQKNVVLVDSSTYAVDKFVKELEPYDYIQAVSTKKAAVDGANNIIKPLNFITILYITVGSIIALMVLFYQVIFITDERIRETGDTDLAPRLLTQHFLGLVLASGLGFFLGSLAFDRTTSIVVRDNISIIPEIYWLDFVIIGIGLVVAIAFLYLYESSKYQKDEEFEDLEEN